MKDTLLISAFLGLITAAGFAGIADGWVLEQISNSGYIDGDAWPQVSETAVTWGEWRDGEYQVFFWDGDAIQQISQSPGDCGYPQISGNNVTWRQDIGGTAQIMFFNGTTTTQLTSGSNYRQDPRISGTHVVWIEIISGNRSVVLWNGTSKQTLSSNDCGQAVIDGDNVAWVDNYTKIRLWNGTATTLIAQTTETISQLGLSGNQIIWLETESGLPEEMGPVKLWDGSSVIQLTVASGGSQPRISEGNAAWIENTQMMYWDGLTISTLTANFKQKKVLAISSSRVIWSEQPTLVPVFLLYLWDEDTLVRFTDMPGSSYPTISGDRIVWLAYNADYDLQVFLAVPGTIPPAIPGDINHDQNVDILDFSILSENWLK